MCVFVCVDGCRIMWHMTRDSLAIEETVCYVVVVVGVPAALVLSAEFSNPSCTSTNPGNF